MAMDHVVKAAPAKESALGRLCRPRRFESKALETIYQKYSLASQRRTLIKVLWVFATVFLSLAALNVYFVRAPNIHGICYGALCAVFVVLLAAVVQIKRNILLQRLIVYATLQFLLVFVVLSLPINYAIRLRTRSADQGGRMAIADGAWTVVVTVFAVYTTLPVRSVLALAFGVATSLAQLIVAATLVDLYEDGVGQQVSVVCTRTGRDVVSALIFAPVRAQQSRSVRPSVLESRSANRPCAGRSSLLICRY
jgi:hypothetical protein